MHRLPGQPIERRRFARLMSRTVHVFASESPDNVVGWPGTSPCYDRWRSERLIRLCKAHDSQRTQGHPASSSPSTASSPTSTSASCELIGREPTITELGIFSAMWNEHCSYKSSKVHLRTLPTTAPLGDPGAGRERRRDRHRRRARLRVQDGEPQPPELHRALPGRGDRRRRHPARRVHHGGAADRLPQCAVASAIRSTRRRAISCPAWSPASAATATRSACRRSAAQVRFHPRYDGNCLVNAMAVGPRRDRQDLLCGGDRRRQADRLSRLEDRPRRHPRRHHGVGRVRRGRRGEAPDRAGRRSVRREAAARGLPRDHGARTASSRSRTWARRG